nr:uncharacterized protein LOC112071435 [Salvelinus alpinus]
MTRGQSSPEFFSAWRWKVYDRQPHQRIPLLQAMEEACGDIDQGSCQAWIRDSRRYFPRCLAQDNIACDVDEPAGHNTWGDDQPITVDEGSGTSTQHIIVIESADTETVGPGVKLERSEGEEDPRQRRDIQTGAAGEPPVATKDPTTTPAQPRTRCSITEVSGTPNAVLKSETDTKTLTVTQMLSHTGSDHRSDPKRLSLGRLGCPPSPGSEYLSVLHQSQGTVNSYGDKLRVKHWR